MFMQSQGVKQSVEDLCLYVKHPSNDKVIMLILYVDDMLIARHDKKDIQNLQKKLCKHFDMKDFGDANHILGMCITRYRKRGLLY